MNFTKAGRVVAYLALALGICGIGWAFAVAPDVTGGYDRVAMRQTNLLMTQGSVVIFFGLALGVLCEISAKMDRAS